MPCPRGAAEAGADFLDRDHQRICQQHRPADAELRAGLAVGADAGRSSSDAPVINPGPRTPIKRRSEPVSIGLSCFPCSAVMASVIRSDCVPLRRKPNGDLGATFHGQP